MAMNSVYAAIEKFTKADDGTLTVYGIASTEAVDNDGEVIKADAMRAALPNFFVHGTGALREMHGKIAAGTVEKANVDDKGVTHITATVVDPVAVLKVEKGVYKGFSIGGRYTTRDPGNDKIVTGIRLNEISLVDRPCNPEATLCLAKVDDDGEHAPDAIEKGMGHVAQLAMLLKELGYMTADQADEAKREGDGSKVPARLQAWLKQGAGILTDMTTEESGELAASSAPPAKTEKAEPEGDLAKAGARNSKTDGERIQSMHDATTMLGAVCGSDGEAEKLAKVDAGEALAKVTVDRDEALAKVAGLTADLAKAAARVTELEDMPAAPKGALRTFAKSDDLVSAEMAAMPQVLKLDGTVSEGASLIKAARAGLI